MPDIQIAEQIAELREHLRIYKLVDASIYKRRVVQAAVESLQELERLKPARGEPNKQPDKNIQPTYEGE